MGDTSGGGGQQPHQGTHPLEAAASRAAAEPSDKTALAELFDALYEPVVRFMQARVYEPATAEDLAQEVFVKMVQKIGGYTGGGIYAWVWAIARNVISDHFRRLRNRGYEQPTDEIWQLDLPSTDLGPDEKAQWSELRQAINQRLNKLPEAQRDVLRLRLVAGLSTTETAEVLAKPVGTIRVLQCRALAKLRKLMPSEDSTLATYLLSSSSGQREEALTNAAPVRLRESGHAGSRR